MGRGWRFVLAILALATVGILPLAAGIGTMPSFFKLIAFLALCSAPVGIVRITLKGANDDAGAEEGMAELRDEIAALRAQISDQLADVTLAIDDMDTRRLEGDRHGPD